MAMIELTTENFEKEVLQSKLPVIVDYWAAWCGPCRMFSPIIEEVSEEFKGKIVFGKINTDENSDIATQYNIMSIPTAMMFKNGQVKATSIGAIPKESLRKWIKENM